MENGSVGVGKVWTGRTRMSGLWRRSHPSARLRLATALFLLLDKWRIWKFTVLPTREAISE